MSDRKLLFVVLIDTVCSIAYTLPKGKGYLKNNHYNDRDNTSKK